MPKRSLVLLCAVVAYAVLLPPAYAISLTDATGVTARGEEVSFHGKILKSHNVSGVAVVGDRLVIVSDEGKEKTVAPVLDREGARSYRVLVDVELAASGVEVDLEAVAAEGNVVYVTGSHAATREINGGKFEPPRRNPSRDRSFRFTLNADGSLGTLEGPKSLAPLLDAHPELARPSERLRARRTASTSKVSP